VRVLHLGKFDTLGGIERHVKTLARGLVATGEVEIINLVSANLAAKLRAQPTTATAPSRCRATASSPASRCRHRCRSWRAGCTAASLRHRSPALSRPAGPPDSAHLAKVGPPGNQLAQRHHPAAEGSALYGPFLRHFVRNADGLHRRHAPAPERLRRRCPRGRPIQLRRVVPLRVRSGAAGVERAVRRQRRPNCERSQPVARSCFTVGRHVYYKGFEVLLRGDGRHRCTADHRRHRTADRESEEPSFLRSRGSRPVCRLHPGGGTDRLLRRLRPVFTMPSTDRSEAFGLVQLEAMHLGKPVVSTRLGTGVEFVNVDNVTGLLVTPGDALALGAAIKRLLCRARFEDERLGEAGKARRRKHVFSRADGAGDAGRLSKRPALKTASTR
jgi:hypothetical protein